MQVGGGLSIALPNGLAELNLQRNQQALQTSATRLSSGLRINSAADDPSGFAIATTLHTQVAAFDQGARNVQDANNALTVADGAMAAVTGIVQRIRTLAIEAASDFNSSADRANIQAEIDQLVLEINRIQDNANFNGLKLLEGGPTFLGPQLPTAQPFVRQNAAASSIVPTTTLTVNLPAAPTAGDLLVAGVTYFFPGEVMTPPPGWTLLDNFQAVLGGYATFMRVAQPGDPASYTWNFSSAPNNFVSASIVELGNINPNNPIDVHAAGGVFYGPPVAVPVTATTPTVTPTSNDFGIAFTGVDFSSTPTTPVTNPAFTELSFVPNTYHEELTQIDPSVPAGVPISTGTVWNVQGWNTGGMMVLVGPGLVQKPIELSLAVHYGDQEGATVPITLPNVNSALLGLTGVDVTSFASAETTIGTCDSALAIILEDRAQLGAQLVSLNQQVQMNNIASVNLQAAASNIQDVDVPQEATTYTRLQLLVQVGTSVLGQANLSADDLLTLFR